MSSIKETYSLVSNTTGQIIYDNFPVETLEDKKRKSKAYNSKKEYDDFKELQNKLLGNFVFFMFESIEYLNKILSDSELVKFMFIGTYVKQDGYLKLDNNFTYIDKSRLKQLLNINAKNFNLLFSKFISEELLKEDEKGNILINMLYFYRGYEKDYKKLTNTNLDDFSRVYTRATRNLYMDSKSTKHKQLAIAYKLLPYVNWRYNILCTNTNEQDKLKIEVLNISDIVNILGLSKSNITRFRNDFYGIGVGDKQLFLTVQKTADYNKSIICVNPLVYYRGSKILDLQYLSDLFELDMKI